MSAPAEPGSAPFEAALADRLRTLPVPLRIQDRWRHSRNTLLYRLVPEGGAGEGTWIAKAYCTKPASQLVEEHRVLQALAARLPANDAVRSLEPAAVWEDLGVAVTREARGRSLRALLVAGNARGAEAREAERLRELLDRAAGALFRFHEAFGIRVADGVERARMYLDFSPVNLLVSDDGGMVLLDPPEFDEEGEVHADLGTFCFELSRAGLRPDQVARYAHGRVPALKAAFVRAYFARLGRAATDVDLARVRRYERARARQVLGWYVPFWRYRSPARELARACWFVPAILFYDRVMMPGTYRGAGAE